MDRRMYRRGGGPTDRVTDRRGDWLQLCMYLPESESCDRWDRPTDDFLFSMYLPIVWVATNVTDRRTSSIILYVYERASFVNSYVHRHPPLPPPPPPTPPPLLFSANITSNIGTKNQYRFVPSGANQLFKQAGKLKINQSINLSISGANQLIKQAGK